MRIQTAVPSWKTLLFISLIAGLPATRGQDAADRVPAFPTVEPTPPAQVATTFRTLHGFSMQLLAAEPLIADPVDVAYDEDGRAYVAEMRDYPYPEEKGAKPTEFPGRIALLEDRDQDGIFETSHPFAEMLSWPTSVVCWKGGVYVAAAPDIWYFKDHDGDHRADERRRVFTGFSRDNVQAIMNGLRWGLDNQIYGAASGNGGTIVTEASPAAQPVRVTRHDFRFDPRTEKFEAIPGGARFGNSFDDWGNRFVCNIRNPVQHVVVSDGSLTRNPLFAAPSAVHDVAESGDQLPVFRISPPEAWRVFRAQRWAAERVNYPRSELIGAGFWTSSSGVTIYRGSAYPAEYQGDVFVGEVAGNLIHRQKLETNGATFVSRRADPNAEFVASTDIWFRPVNFVNAPDGTLHVLDMYRETIEHPWSIPEDIKEKLNLRSGNDRGRLYRLAPPGFRFAVIPRLSQATTAELVRYLDHANAWHRETAQRLLLEREDPAAVEPLREMVQNAASPLGRLHALFALDGQRALTEQEILAGLADETPQLRRLAVVLAQARLEGSADLRKKVLNLAADEAPMVRFQVALAAGAIPQDEAAARALAQIASRDFEDDWMTAAVLSSSGGSPLSILTALLTTPDLKPHSNLARLVREMAYYATASSLQQAGPVAELLEKLPADSQALRFAIVSGLGKGLERHRRDFSQLSSIADEETNRRLTEVRAAAARVAADERAPLEARLEAIELLRFEAAEAAIQTLEQFLTAREPLAVQLAAVRLLRNWPRPEVAQLLVERWKQGSATTRQETIEALLSRAEWVPALLAALERNEIAAGQLAITQRARLVNSANPALQERATKLLGPAVTSARGEVVRSYQPALRLTGSAARGEVVVKRECLTCHRLGTVGHDVGPNLNTIRHRSAEEILIHVFDPNRDVPPQFISHTVQLKDGRVLTGLIANENETSLELLRAENARDTVFRQDIEEIASSNQSLMPEGMEQKLSHQDVADLISYLLGQERDSEKVLRPPLGGEADVPENPANQPKEPRP